MTLNEQQLAVLRGVVEAKSLALGNLAARPLLRRKLVFVRSSCPDGCCRWFSATPAGFRVVGRKAPKNWRSR